MATDKALPVYLPVDIETYDLGWNQALERAAATAKIAAGLGAEGSVSGDALSSLILQLKRADVSLHEKTVTHTLTGAKGE